MNMRLYITNISTSATEAELTQVFMQAGTVVSLHIATDPRTSVQRSYGFVEMETVEMTKAAFEKVNGYLLHDRRLKVSQLSAPGGRKSFSLVEDEPDARRSKRRSGSERAN